MENFPFSVMNEAIFENRDRIRENHFIFWTDSDDSKSSYRMTLIRLLRIFASILKDIPQGVIKLLN